MEFKWAWLCLIQHLAFFFFWCIKCCYVTCAYCLIYKLTFGSLGDGIQFVCFILLVSFPPTEVLTLFLATENLWQSVVHCVTTQAPLEGYNQLDTLSMAKDPPFKSLPSSPIFSLNCDSFCLGCKECNHVKTQFSPFSFWLCGLFLVDNIPTETVDSSSAVDGKAAFLYILFPFFPFIFER